MQQMNPAPRSAEPSRRNFLAGAAAATVATFILSRGQAQEKRPRFGLVTYQWGKDWDLPALIANCETAKAYGVELRTTHAHGVERTLNAAERRDVMARFNDTPVINVGIGSNERFDNPDPEVVKAAIAATKDFVKLSHDVGGSGVKVKPDSFHEGVEREKTIAQIAASLEEAGTFAQDYGQEIRLEMHGRCGHARTIAAIMDQVSAKNVAVCWNSNDIDLEDGGVEANFARVRDRFGDTLHVRELNSEKYPFDVLMRLLVETKYAGWVMIEASSEPPDRVAALAEQAKLFDAMLQAATDAAA